MTLFLIRFSRPPTLVLSASGGGELEPRGVGRYVAGVVGAGVVAGVVKKARVDVV